MASPFFQPLFRFAGPTRGDARRREKRDAAARLSSELQRKQEQWRKRKKEREERDDEEGNWGKTEIFRRIPERIRDVLSHENSGTPRTGASCTLWKLERREARERKRARTNVCTLIPSTTPSRQKRAML